uniref:Putative phospholipid-transporting ATPase DNF3 n=1 Tax=Lygus hesperus TaxID=30085 RepID=A0A0A9WLP8_LYGHE
MDVHQDWQQGSHNHAPSKNLGRERLNNAMRSYALTSSVITTPSDIIKEMVATNNLGDELKAMSKQDIKLIRDTICRIKSKRTLPLFRRRRRPHKVESRNASKQEAQVPLPIKVDPYAEECSTTNDSFQIEYRSEDANESRSSVEVVIKMEPDDLHELTLLASDTSLKLNSTETLEDPEIIPAEGEDPLSITTPEPKAIEPAPAEPSAVQYEKNTERDPIDDFFRAMATTVKALPPLLQLQVKQKVTQAVFEAESLMLSMN